MATITNLNSTDNGSTSMATINDNLDNINADLVSSKARLEELYENVVEHGAVGDGETDDTDAIQEALDTGNPVYFPPGTYKITSAIYPGGYQQIIKGAGWTKTIINLTGAINGFVDNADLTYTQVHISDLKITGDDTTLNAINFEKLTYGTTIKNFYGYTGGNAIYMPDQFNCVFEMCWGASYNDHCFEIEGGNTTTFIGCYALFVPAGKVGYKIKSGGTYIGCNGINTGEAWGMWGWKTADEGSNAQYRPVFIRCNFEAFTSYAVKLKYDGRATFIECNFAPDDTFDTCIWTTYCSQQVRMINCWFNTSGKSRSKLADLYGEASVKYLMDNDPGETVQYDRAGVLTDCLRYALITEV